MEKWIPSEEETFAHIGCMLLLTQQVEDSTASLIGTIYPDGNPSWEELGKLNKSTFGALVRKLKERVELDPRFEVLLEAFLAHRNLFVHNLTRQSWFDMHSETGRDKIWNFLEEHQKCLEEVYLVVSAAIFKRYEASGFPRTEWHDKLKETGFLQIIQGYYPKSHLAFREKKK